MDQRLKKNTYIEELCDFVLACGPGKIPDDVRHKASLFILDTLGVAVANSPRDYVRAYAGMIENTVVRGAATAIGFSQRYAAEGAAAINSTAIHGNDFDATHRESIMHPCAVVIPVALAVAEEVGSDGSEVLSAIVAGFEVLIRMGLATRGAMHWAGFQGTALCAPVVLTMVAGRLYGMPREQIVSATGLSTAVAAGLRSFKDDGTWGKRVITGWSCRTALMATALARSGYPGSRDALEKQVDGFYRSFVPSGQYDLTELTKGLGAEWVTCDVEIKRYPCTHGLHTFINTARRVKEELNLQPEQIASVIVHVSAEAASWWFEPRERKYTLPHAYGARFSFPYAVALALVFGDVVDEYLESKKFLDDPRVRELVPRINPRVDSSLSHFNPNLLPGTLEIATTDGRTVMFKGTGLDTGKEVENETLEKFRLNTRPTLSEEAATELIALTRGVEAQSDVEKIMALLRPTP